MATQVISELAALIRREAGVLLERWRAQVRQLPSAKHLSVPTLNDHIPQLLEELAEALESGSDETIAEALRGGTPPAHGVQRFHDGFDINEVVAEYNILRGCIHDLAIGNGVDIRGEVFHILNRVLDGAIGLAVETYSMQRALDVQQRREEYLAFVAHDLRTPLNAISLAASVLELTSAPGPGEVEKARMIKSLHRNVAQLEAMVRKVLDENSSLETETGVKLHRRTLDLWPLVEALIHDVKPVAGTSSTLLINEVPEDMTVFADAGLLRRIFQNLIGNAIKYAPQGEVRIGAEELTDQGGISCSVSDTGSGIPQHLLETVFQKGVGDPERADSTGLGLAIVKTFVEAHGGTVVAESGDAPGTTIRFTLPMVAPGASVQGGQVR